MVVSGQFNYTKGTASISEYHTSITDINKKAWTPHIYSVPAFLCGDGGSRIGLLNLQASNLAPSLALR